ncbi:MAG: hypothetical protein J5973_08250 [Eubacterium sp.]|nr:hypothetical protein [Eubacterium sp.]
MKKLGEIFYKFICGILFLLSGLLLFINLYGSVHYNLEDGSKIWKAHTAIFYIFVACIICVVVYRKYTNKSINNIRLREKPLFLFFAAALFIVCIYLIHNSSEQLWSDPYMINKYMPEFLKGDFSGFSDGKYFSYNPNLAGFAMYEMLLTRICNRVHFLYFANLITVELILWFQWRISQLIYPKSENMRIVIIVASFLFLPLPLHLFFVYGTLPGYLFAQISIWFYYRWLSLSDCKYNALNLFFSALTLTISCILKQNFYILMIALVIHGSWYLICCEKKKMIPKMLILLILPIIGSSLFMNVFKQRSGIEIGTGEPVVLYIAMGLQENESNPLDNGWYNGYNFETYQKNNYDEELSAQEGKAYINMRLRELMDPAVLTKFLIPKLASTWADPTFESVYLGPSEFSVGKSENGIIGSIYGGDRLYHVIEGFMKFYTIVFYLAVLFHSIEEIRSHTIRGSDKKALLVCVYLIGGFLFHMISETKSSYVYYYVFSMILWLPTLIVKPQEEDSLIHQQKLNGENRMKTK